MNLILITGGARAGKSVFAQKLARTLAGDKDVCFVATAEAKDEEMSARIAAHRAERPAGWATIEAPRNLAAELRERAFDARVVIVDCITLLVSNVQFGQPEPAEWACAWRDVEAEIDGFIRFAATSPATVIVVTNEVGLGIIPMERISRLYLDLLGKANQKLAAAADEVYFMVAGIPLAVKSGGRT